MNCSKALPLLDPLADGALDTRDSTLVLAHIKECTSCQAEWREIESLQERFKRASSQEVDASHVLNKVRAQINEESKVLPIMFNRVSVAAMLVLAVGVAEFSAPAWLSAPTLNALVVAQADDLVDRLSQNIQAAPVSKESLPRLLGYSPVYLRLPDWHMDAARADRTAGTGIAMFAFSRDADKLVCYQTLAGTIGRGNTQAVALGKINAHVGQRGKYNYVVWSSNGRDYLMVSAIARERLLETVRKSAV
jgi:hypothetical protein